MNFEKVIPIKWKEFDNEGSLKMIFYCVTFTENFGIFEKDEYIDWVLLDYEKGILKAYNGPDLIKKQFFKACPINEE